MNRIVVLSLLILTACTSPTPEPTSTPSATPLPSATASAVPTDTPEPTATASATLTPTASVTPSPTASATATPVPPTATNPPAPTASATALPQPTATPAPVSTGRGSVPFDTGLFITRLDEAHAGFQAMLHVLGYAMKGQMGNCSTVFFHYDGWALQPAFVNVPDNWSALTAEYIAWLDQAHEVMLPLYELCQGGGGTLSDDNDRILADFLDEAQNGLYELMLAADAMK